MDGTGSEASKRPRLDFNNASHRPQQQPPIAPSHTLPPPNSYPPQAPPPSPYHQSVAPELRSLPEPTPHGYSQFHSGHNTPIRDVRSFPLDTTSYSRRGSASGSTRSPEEYNHFPSTRPLSTVAPSDGPHYPAPPPLDHPGPFPAYQGHDGPLNGAAHHGLPMTSYAEHNHTGPGHPSDYLPSPTNMVHPQYAPAHPAVSSGPPNMHRPKKGTRAQQVCGPVVGRDPCGAAKLSSPGVRRVSRPEGQMRRGPTVVRVLHRKQHDLQLPNRGAGQVWTPAP